MESNLTDTILMIKPVHFRANDQTAVNNHYQKTTGELSPDEAQQKATEEFDQFVSILREKGVNVIVMLDNDNHDTPDSIFPNNWISFHEDGKVGLYPMFAENRRLERREDISDFLELKGYSISGKIDLTHWENQGKFLEATGSLVLDRENKLAYAALSERTSPEVIAEFEEKFAYQVIAFHANHTVKKKKLPIYHTNVMMSIGDAFCIICLDSIDDEAEKHEVILSLASSGKEIIKISKKQLTKFAGNMLQVKNENGEKLMVMSQTALESLNEKQIDEISKYNQEIISSPMETIETLGGGSARCMMAEVFLPKI